MVIPHLFLIFLTIQQPPVGVWLNLYYRIYRFLIEMRYIRPHIRKNMFIRPPLRLRTPILQHPPTPTNIYIQPSLGNPPTTPPLLGIIPFFLLWELHIAPPQPRANLKPLTTTKTASKKKFRRYYRFAIKRIYKTPNSNPTTTTPLLTTLRRLFHQLYRLQRRPHRREVRPLRWYWTRSNTLFKVFGVTRWDYTTTNNYVYNFYKIFRHLLRTRLNRRKFFKRRRFVRRFVRRIRRVKLRHIRLTTISSKFIGYRFSIPTTTTRFVWGIKNQLPPIPIKFTTLFRFTGAGWAHRTGWNRTARVQLRHRPKQTIPTLVNFIWTSANTPVGVLSGGERRAAARTLVSIFNTPTALKRLYLAKIKTHTTKLVNYTAFHIPRLLITPQWAILSTTFEQTRTHMITHQTILRRIRFRPGLLTVWRTARTELQTQMQLMFKYQHRLTRFLGKFNHFLATKLLLQHEFQLSNILLRSTFFSLSAYVSCFLRTAWIYINGQLVQNPRFQLFINDRLQITTTLRYYVVYRWLQLWTAYRLARIQRYNFKRQQARLIADDKTRSTRFPIWVKSLYGVRIDVVPFLEVDFLSLTVIILFEPLREFELNYFNLYALKIAILNTYNWKYIT